MNDTTTDLSTADKVIEFLQRDDVLGELGYDKFMDYAEAYGEPGYGSVLSEPEISLIVLGNFWCRCDNYEDEQWPDSPLHSIEVHWPEEFARMEEAGVEFVWYDEWTVVHEYVDGQPVANAYRTTPDSYHWKPSAILDEDSCEYMTPNNSDEEWIEWALNNPHRCIPDNMLDAHDPTLVGWDDEAEEPQQWWEYNVDDEDAGVATTFQNGWHAGQDADPEKITEEIRAKYGEDTDVVFVLDETSQFYIGFSAYYRRNEQV